MAGKGGEPDGRVGIYRRDGAKTEGVTLGEGRRGVGDAEERRGWEMGGGGGEGGVWNGFGRTVGSCVGIETKLH